MLELARAFKPEKVIFVTNVDGVFTLDPKSGKDVELLPIVDMNTFRSLRKGESEVNDVTGSIFGKLDMMFKIATLGLETLILNGTVESRLRDALLGKEVICTRIVKGN